jgi:hypothetical protein
MINTSILYPSLLIGSIPKVTLANLILNYLLFILLNFNIQFLLLCLVIQLISVFYSFINPFWFYEISYVLFSKVFLKKNNV